MIFLFDDQMLDMLYPCILGKGGIHLRLSIDVYLLSQIARLQPNPFNISIPGHFPTFTIQPSDEYVRVRYVTVGINVFTQFNMVNPYPP